MNFSYFKRSVGDVTLQDFVICAQLKILSSELRYN